MSNWPPSTAWSVNSKILDIFISWVDFATWIAKKGHNKKIPLTSTSVKLNLRTFLSFLNNRRIFREK